MKLKITLNIQSYSSIITNSSSEVFCVIKSDSEDSIKMVQDYLNSFLPNKVDYTELDYEDGIHRIFFEMEYGSSDSEILGETMYYLIKKLLEEHFPGDNNFIVEDGYNYN